MYFYKISFAIFLGVSMLMALMVINFNEGKINFSPFPVSVTIQQDLSVGGNNGGSGGGSGNSGSLGYSLDNLNVFPDEIIISLVEGEEITKELILTNDGNRPLDLNIFIPPSLEDVLSLEMDVLTLNPQESETVFLDFSGLEVIPELYVGNLIITSGNIYEEIFVSVEIESLEALFDISLNLKRSSKLIYPGENIIFDVGVINIWGDNLVQVAIEYFVKDSKGIVLFSDIEIRNIEGSETFEKKINLPLDIENGRYSLYAKLTYDGKIVSSRDTFRVIRISFLPILILLIFILVLVIYHVIRKKKIKRLRKNKPRGFKSRFLGYFKLR